MLMILVALSVLCLSSCAANTNDPYRRPDPMYQQNKDLCNNILDPEARAACLRQAEGSKYN